MASQLATLQSDVMWISERKAMSTGDWLSRGLFHLRAAPQRHLSLRAQRRLETDPDGNAAVGDLLLRTVTKGPIDLAQCDRRSSVVSLLSEIDMEVSRCELLM